MPTYRQLSRYLKRIDKSGTYTNFGPLSVELENRLAKHLGIQPNQICSIANATLGISGLITTAFTKPDVQVPSWTFTATPAAILLSGFNIEFVDVDATTWESQIPQNEIQGVHVLPFGGSGMEIPEKQTPVIIDAAASFANLGQIKLPKNRDWAVVVSLHATKTLGAGEGGFVYSNNPEWISDLKAWTNFGFSGTRESRAIGTNSKMSEYHAAVALASLDLWPSTHKKLLNLTTKCLEVSRQLGITTHPAMQSNQATPYWIVRLDSPEQKKELQSFLLEKNIDSRDWWSAGAAKMHAYQGCKSKELRVTNILAATTIGLPFHLDLSSKDLARITQALQIATK